MMTNVQRVMRPPPLFYREPQDFAQMYYKQNAGKTAGAIILSIVTLGIYPMICLCKRELWIKVAYEKCDPDVCTIVILKELLSGKEHPFDVQYFSVDGVHLKRYRRLTPLKQSVFVKMRIDVGQCWMQEYDSAEKAFKPIGRFNLSDNKQNNLVQFITNKFSSASKSVETQLMLERLERGVGWLNKDDEDEANELVGFQRVSWRSFVYNLASILSLGFFSLFCYWQPYLRLRLTHRRCGILRADTLLVMMPPTNAKKRKSKPAVRILPAWIECLFDSGTVLLICAIIPIGFIFLPILLMYLITILRPYSVRSIKHSTRDGQMVSFDAAETSNYFKVTSCSDAAVIKFFTWKKIKYVWSGTAVNAQSPKPITLQLWRFERQTGLVASEDFDGNELYFKHQLLGILPTIRFFHSCTGLTYEKAALLRDLIGRNMINLPLTALPIVFLQKILSPFYVYQACSVTLFIYVGYSTYAYIIIVMSVGGTIWQMMSIRLEEMAIRRSMHLSNPVDVIRPGTKESVSTQPDIIVPGDVIAIPTSGCVLQCDAVLLSGTCLVDEAMLTGESVPVLKIALPSARDETDELLQIRKNQRNILFCGTKVLQANSPGSKDDRVHAVVLRTGFMTTKGELTRLILYPKPLNFQFAADTAKFIAIMCIFGAVAVFYSVGLLVYRDEDPLFVFLLCIIMFASVVEPILPISLTIGYMMAQKRLLRQHIFCTSPSAINVAGCVDIVCMDKTGTMTEGGLNFKQLLPVRQGQFLEQLDPATIPDGKLLRCLVSCHSLALFNGKVIGDPIEEQMFRIAGWKLVDLSQNSHLEQTADGQMFYPITVVQSPYHGSAPIGVVRMFPFSSEVSRMSVVACPLGASEQNEGLHLYLKGAPEVIIRLCRPSAIPVDLETRLDLLTEKGFRVLGLAAKSLGHYTIEQAMSADRSELEQDMDFLGLLIFENKLKPETRGVVRQLTQQAQMRVIMLTGDNLQTATSVARQAGLIGADDRVLFVNAVAPTEHSLAELDYIEMKSKYYANTEDTLKHEMTRPVVKSCTKLALTGATLAVIKQYFPLELDKILMKAVVFARVNPNQKKDVVEGLQQLGHFAIMCGDGANDCGALRAASTGISLSQAEASVASPFTSKNEKITCVPLLIREGRCSIVTSFGMFRFMLFYGVIVLAASVFLVHAYQVYSNNQYMYMDIFLVICLVVAMSFSEAPEVLVPERPPTSLIELTTLLTLLFQSILVYIFELVAFMYVTRWEHPWFIPYFPADSDRLNYKSFETYSLFMVTIFQYPCLAFVSTKGLPFMKPAFKNIPFCIVLFIELSAAIFLTFDPTLPFPKEPRDLIDSQYSSFGDMLGVIPPPSIEYRVVIFLIAAIYCCSSILVDKLFIERKWLINGLRRLYRKISNNPNKSRIKYEILQDQLANGKWPPTEKQFSKDQCHSDDALESAGLLAYAEC